MNLQYKTLVVDDAATVRMYHRTILEAEGILVDEAINGIEAMEMVLQAETPYDLFLVDINMPLQGGYKFTQELRSSDAQQSPVVVISSESKEFDKQRALEAGANFYLCKPIKPAELLEVVNLLLGITKDA